MQPLIYKRLLTITCLHNKAAVVIEMLVKSICLGVQYGQLDSLKGQCVTFVIVMKGC